LRDWYKRFRKGDFNLKKFEDERHLLNENSKFGQKSDVLYQIERELSFNDKRSRNFTKKLICTPDIHSVESRLGHDVSPEWIIIKVNHVQISSCLSPGTQSSTSIFIAFVAIGITWTM